MGGLKQSLRYVVIFGVGIGSSEPKLRVRKKGRDGSQI